MKTKKFFVLIFLIAPVCMSAQVVGNKTQNTEVHNRNEYNDSDYGSWDQDASGDVNQDEFNRTYNEDYYNRWDQDRDGQIDITEFDQGMSTYYSDYEEDNEYRDYKNWDKDEDGVIDINEFQSGTYRTYDTNGDNRLSESELKVRNMNKPMTRSTKEQEIELRQR